MKTSRFHKTFGLVQAVVIIASMVAALACAHPSMAQAGVPVFRPETLAYPSFQEDASNNGQVIADDSDGPSLTYSVVTQPAHGYLRSFNASTGAFIYRGDGDYNGADTFRVRVTDGTNPVEADVSITLQPVEDAPVAVDDGVYTVASDTYAWIDAQTGGTAQTWSTSGDYTGMIKEDINPGFLVPYFNGLYDRVRLWSNGSVELYNSTGTDQLNINVLYGLDANRYTAIVGLGSSKYVNNSTSTVYTRQTVSGSQFVIQFNNVLDNQVSGQPTTYEVVLNSSGVITLQYQNLRGFVDGVGLASPYFHTRNTAGNYIPGVYLNRTLLGHAANNAYTFTPVQPYLADFNTAISPTLSIASNDFDPDGSLTGTRSVKNLPEHGTLTLNTDGTFSYTPTTGYIGRDRFTYRITQTDGRFMDGDVHVYVRNTALSSGAVIPASIRIWAAGSGNGILQGYDHLARPFRFTVTTSGYTFQPMYFFPATGMYAVYTESTSGSATWTGAVQTQSGTSATANLNVSMASGTITSVDGLYTRTATQYTSTTQPWDELGGDPLAVDLAPQLTDSQNQDEHQFDVNLGFSFPLGHTTYTKVFPNTNGFLTFGRASQTLMVISKAGAPIWELFSSLFMLTQDGVLNPKAVNPAHLYYRTFTDGSGNPTRFVVEYVNHAVYNSASKISTYEAVLFPNGNIEVRYRTLNANQNSAGLQYTPPYGPDDGDPPAPFGVNYPAYNLANYLTVTYQTAANYSAEAGTPRVVDAAHGVRANDFSATSGGTDTPTLSVKIPPAHGTVTLNNDGSFTYNASVGYSGTDYFVYSAVFNGVNAENVVAIDVTNTAPQPPVINSVTGATTVYDGSTVTLNINATDANGDALDYSYTLSGGGTLDGADIDQSTGVFTWPHSVEGTYEVTFRAFQENDHNQYDDSDPVTITVNHNNPPVFDPPTGSLTANEGSTLSFTLNAHDDEGDGLTYSMVSGPSAAVFTPGTRAFSWLTGEADDGTHSVTFRAAETNTPTRYTEQTYSLTVNEIAEPPVIDAPTGNLTINEGATFNITINAHDADSDPLTYSMTSTNSGGTFNAVTHIFTWATGEADNGSYSATFRVAETATPTRYTEQTYTLTVNEVNQAPVISGITGPTSVLEETSVTLTVNATDADLPANTLTYGVTGLPSGATFSASTGVLNWSSAVTGTYPMTFTATDNGSPVLSDSEPFTLTVTGNQPPVIDGLTGDTTINEGGTFSITVNAHDTEGDALTYSNPSGPAGSTFNASTHVFTWATSEVDSGPHSVTFRVAETGHPARYDEETYTLTVNEVNQAPTITGITGPSTVLEGTNVQLSVSATDADVPANAFSYTVTGEPSGAAINHSTGVLTYNNAAVGVYHMTFTVTDDGTPPLSGTYDFTLTVNANTAPVIDSISSGRTVNEGSDMTITVTAHDNESDPLTYTASGLPGGANYGWSGNVLTWHTTETEDGAHSVTFRVAETSHPARYSEQTVTLTVNEINEAPTITGISGPTSAGEGSNVTLTVNATDADTPGSMTYAVSGAPSGSTFDTNTGVLTYNNAVTGSYPMTFTVHDHGTPDLTDTESFTLTITDVDFMPQVTDVTGTRTLNEGQTFHLTVVASDRDNDTLTYSVTSGLPAGASPTWSGNQFTWVTGETHNGTHHVTFRAAETAHPTHYGELTVDLVVNEINEPPVINSISGPTSIPESQPVTLTVNATDADTPSLMTYEVSNAPAGSSFNTSTGVFTWGSAVQGVYTMTFTVHDHDPAGDLTDTETFTLTVTDVDHLPEITAIDGATTVNEGSTMTLTVTGTDGDNDPLVYSMTSGPAGSTFNPTTHIFTWVTTEADNGSHSVTFRVAETTHANHYAEQTVSLTVNEINEAPSITSITGPTAITEGHAVTLTVHATDVDTPGLLTYAVSYPGSTPVGATLNASTGVWSWSTPTPGTYDLVFTVHDNDPAGDMTDSETFTLSVSQYQLPVIDSITGTTTINEGTPLTLTVAAHDPENGTLSYDVLGLPGGASSSWAGNILTWNTVEADGPHTFTLTIRVTADSNPARRASQDVSVTVNEVNRTPVLDLTAYTNHGEWVNELEAASFVIGGTDPDVPANTLSYSMTGAPAGATLDPVTGAFLWTPAHAQANHDYTFKVRVTDAGGMYDENNITLKVNARPLFTIAPTTVNGVINRPVTFTVAAQDPDARPGGLTYAVVGSLPAGAAFDPATRTFTWTPTDAQTGSFGIILSVSDGLATTQTTVTVRIDTGFFRYLPFLIGY